MAEAVYRPVIAVAKGFTRALGLQLSIRGTQHIPVVGGGVLVVNHVGYLDFVYAGYAANQVDKRLVRFLAKKEMFDKRGLGWLLRGMHHIPVDREAGASSYSAAVDALRAGELIGMFPEATISRSFCLKDFKTGAARMAVEAGVPLIPVVVWGTQRLITKGRPRNLKRRTPISVDVGVPLSAQPGDDASVLTKELKERMQVLLEDAQQAYPEQPAGDDDRWWLPVHLGGTAPTLEQAEELDAADIAERRARRAAANADPTKRKGRKRG